MKLYVVLLLLLLSVSNQTQKIGNYDVRNHFTLGKRAWQETHATTNKGKRFTMRRWLNILPKSRLYSMKLAVEGSDSEGEVFPTPREKESAALVQGSKRYGFQEKKVVAELYQFREGDMEKVWRQIRLKESGVDHTTFLHFHTLFQLRKCLAKGALMLDLELRSRAENISSAFTVIAEGMAKKFKANEHKLRAILAALCKSQERLPQPQRKKFSSKASVKQHQLEGHNSSEVAQIFASAMPELEKAKFAMVRLAEALENTHDICSPVRFIFVLLGPPLPDMDYNSLGRSIATLMSNPNFVWLSYKAIDRQDLILGLDKFLDEGIFIPPISGSIAGQITIDGIDGALRKRQQRDTSVASPMVEQEILSHFKEGPRDPLARTGKLFGGLRADLRERVPKYISDFTDALTFKSITSILFIFFACFAPAITFGGLMGTYTEDSMGITEALMAQSLCGLIFAFFSTQPLLILSATGPVLIFEKAFYEICKSLELDFLTIRVWTGLWIMVITFFVVMFEGSALLRYVTRFTEEIFSSIISAIFILGSLKFIYKTIHANPVRDLLYYWYNWEICSNTTNATHFDAHLSEYATAWRTERRDMVHFAYLTEEDQQCYTHNQPDTALLTIILVFATFTVAYLLKILRSSHFLTRIMRQFIGDFGMLISIVFVALLKWVVFDDVFIKLLNIPVSFGFTSMDQRQGLIFISWLLPAEKWWGCLMAIVPAFLVFILLFVETEITELLLIKKERGLVKGSGVHWDMMLLGVLTFLCSLLGLPWMCAAASQSLAHANSLTVMKPADHGHKAVVESIGVATAKTQKRRIMTVFRPKAEENPQFRMPKRQKLHLSGTYGEKPGMAPPYLLKLRYGGRHFRHYGATPMVESVVEQRVTAIVVSVLLGACAFIGEALRLLPIAILFGVFFYLGIIGLLGMQFIHRIVLFLVPAKYFPDVLYCQKVKPKRIHIFTIIQLICVAIVYVVKSFQSALIFPVVLLLTSVLRHTVLPLIFTHEELHALDGEEEEEEGDHVGNDMFSALKF